MTRFAPETERGHRWKVVPECRAAANVPAKHPEFDDLPG
jgi:hypothetical protein